MSKLTDLDQDRVAELAVAMARCARDCGDAVYLMKTLAVACAKVIAPGGVA
jgi:hypothetical protein